MQIGSEISNLAGNIYIPHSNINSINEFTRVIKSIESDCFLQKCYTANIVSSMYLLLCKLVDKNKINLRNLNIGPIEDFNLFMNKPGNMNQQTIQELGLIYLKKLLEIASKISATKEEANLG